MLNPTNLRDRANEWEERIISDFREGRADLKKEVTGEVGEGMHRAMYVARPITIKQPQCMACHSTPAVAPPTMLKVYGDKNGFGWGMNETVGIQVYDAEGRLRWVGSGTPGVVNIADREYFIALRSNPKAGMVVSRPIVGRVAKDWLMPFARRFTRPDGTFAGIVSAVVPLTYFNGLLARPLLGPSGTAVLRYADFSLIARVPQVAGAGAGATDAAPLTPIHRNSASKQRTRVRRAATERSEP